MADNNSTEYEYTYNLKNYFVDEDNYPDEHGYDWMSRSWGDGILDFFNSYDQRAQKYYQHHLDEPDMAEEWLSLYNKVMTLLSGAKDVLSVMHIMVERWSNDTENPWCFADKTMAKRYNESLNEKEDTFAATRPDFWPNPEGSRFTTSSQKTRYLSPKDYGYNMPEKETPKLVWDATNKSWYDPATSTHYHSDGSTATITTTSSDTNAAISSTANAFSLPTLSSIGRN